MREVNNHNRNLISIYPVGYTSLADSYFIETMIYQLLEKKKALLTRRIAANKEAGEFAIFDEHLPGRFHGHSRSWNELTQSMKNILLKNNIVNKKGKIIK